MPFPIYLICHTVQILISVVLFAMLVRCLRALTAFDAEPSALDTVLAVITEPIILPARILIGEAAAQIPLDLPFHITWVALSVLQNFLPIATLA